MDRRLIVLAIWEQLPEPKFHTYPMAADLTSIPPLLEHA
jgi:hypothetical protein